MIGADTDMGLMLTNDPLSTLVAIVRNSALTMLMLSGLFVSSISNIDASSSARALGVGFPSGKHRGVKRKGLSEGAIPVNIW